MSKNVYHPAIPVQLTEEQFITYMLPYLPVGKRGPKPKLPLFIIFNLILHVLHTGIQWFNLPIQIDPRTGKKEISYQRVYAHFKRWVSLDVPLDIFIATVKKLADGGHLDTDILHGDGTCAVAKKGGDNIGRNGHKHHKGDKVIAICDRNRNIIAPFVAAPGNASEMTLFPNAFKELKKIAKLIGITIAGSVMSLDAGYDSRANRKEIFNAKMTPNIKENPRNRKTTKRGRPRIYNEKIFKERFSTIERDFAWEDKFRRLVIRYERHSCIHYGFKLLAYALINLRNFCRPI